RYENSSWSWASHVSLSGRYARALADRRRPGPFHVGVLAANVPEFSFLLGACAFAGAVLVGLNPVRRGSALPRDVRVADCQLLLVEPELRDVLPPLDIPLLGLDEFEPAAAALDPVPAGADDLLMLIFTSGTGGEPKAVRCTHGKIAF